MRLRCQTARQLWEFLDDLGEPVSDRAAIRIVGNGFENAMFHEEPPVDRQVVKQIAKRGVIFVRPNALEFVPFWPIIEEGFAVLAVRYQGVTQSLCF